MNYRTFGPTGWPVSKIGYGMWGMALRFILAEPSVSTMIPEMRKLRHVEVNIATSDAGPLNDALLAELARHRWDREPTEWKKSGKLSKWHNETI